MTDDTIGSVGSKVSEPGRGGVYSNVDVDLTDVERADIEKEIELTDHVAQQMDGHDSYQHTGLWQPGYNELRVTHTHLNQTPKDFRQRRLAGDPIIPVSHYFDETGELHWVLNDVDAQGALEGYICLNCLNWQQSTIELKCNPSHGISCGYTRGVN